VDEAAEEEPPEDAPRAGWQKAHRPQRSTSSSASSTQFYSQDSTSTSQLYAPHPTPHPTPASQHYSGHEGFADSNTNYSTMQSAHNLVWQPPNATTLVQFGVGPYFPMHAMNAPHMHHPYQQALFSVPTQMPPYSQAPHPRWSGGNPQPRWSGSARPDRPAPPHPGRGRRDQSVPAQCIFAADQEAAARTRIVVAEEGAIQELIFQQYRSALVAASAAQRQLALGSATSGRPREWSHREFRTVLTDDFEAAQRPIGQRGSSELPPSLADPVPRNSSPASDTNRSFLGLQLDEEEYSKFRRHFREAPSTTADSLDTPPPCWSPARLTPKLQGNRGPPSSSPGLTPSPADWLAAQRSPRPSSPRAALAFTDWTSPQALGPSQVPDDVTAGAHE
jgi:hypothetical protein